MGLAFGQQVQVGQLIRPIGVVVCIVAGGGIRLAVRIGHALADSAAVRIGTRVGSGRGCRGRGTGGSGRSHRTGCPCERDSTGLGGTGCPRVVYRSPTGHGDGLATGDDAGSGSVAIICIGSRRRAG